MWTCLNSSARGSTSPLYDDSVHPAHVMAMLAGAPAVCLGVFCLDLGMWGICELFLVRTLPLLLVMSGVYASV